MKHDEGKSAGELSDEEPVDGSSSTEDLLAQCFNAEDVDSAVARACEEHPEVATKLRQVYRRMQRFGLTPASDTGTTTSLLPSGAMPQRIGPFAIRERIGEGGMGVVYRAWHERLERDVAIKVVRPEFVHMVGKRARFEREALAIARLSHPSIVPILEVGESEGMPWFAMEYVRGLSLADVLKCLRDRDFSSLDGGNLHAIQSADRVLRDATTSETTLRPSWIHKSWVDLCIDIVAQIASALDHAHARGVLHRDLKPSNIMITPDGRAMLLDFGLARTEEEDQRLTKSSSEIGSLPYMAPELLRGDAIPNPRLDVYGLGVTFYEALTGTNPFLDTTAERTRNRVLDATPLAPRRRNSQVRWDVETVCLTAMAPESEQRYPTASAFFADLDRLQRRLPILAKRPGVLLRTRRWQQRHPVFSAGLLTALLTIAIGATVLLMRERSARDEAQRLQRYATEQRDLAERVLSGTRLAFARSLLLSGNPRDARLALHRITEDKRAFTWRHLELMTDMSERRIELFAPDTHFDCDASKKLLVATSETGQTFAVDLETLEKREWRLGAVRRPSISIHETLVAFSGPGARITIVDAKDGSVRRSFPCGDAVLDPRFGPDERTLVSVTKKSDIVVWDLAPENDTAVERTRFHAHDLSPKNDKTGVVWVGQDRNILLTHDRLRTMRLWKLDGSLVTQIDSGQVPMLQAVAASSDGQHILASCYSFFTDKSRRIVCWNRAGQRLWDYRPTSRGSAIAIHPDFESFVCANQALEIIDLDEREVLGKLMGQQSVTIDLLWTTPEQLISTSRDGIVRLWRIDRMRHRSSYLVHDSTVTSVTILEPSSLVVSGARNGVIVVSEPESGTVRQRLTVGSTRIQGMAQLGPERLVVAGEDGSLRFVTLGAEPRVEGQIDVSNTITALAKVGDRHCVVCDGTSTVFWVDLVARTCTALRLQVEGEEDSVAWQACAATGDLICLGSLDGRVVTLTLDPKSSQEPLRVQRELRVDGRVQLVALTHDKQRVIACTEEGPFYRFDLTSGALLRRYDGHGARPSGIAVARQNGEFFTCAWNQSFMSWDADIEESLLFSPEARTMLLCLALSPTEDFIALGGLDGRVHVLWATRTR